MDSPILDAIEAERVADEPLFTRHQPRHRIEGGGEFAGLWMEVADIDNGTVELLKRTTYDVDVMRLAAPLILAWNVAAPVFEDETVPAEEWDGTTVPARTVPRLVGWERLPAPAVAGPDVFLRVPDRDTLIWIFRRLKGFPELDDTLVKLLAKRAPMPAGTTAAESPVSPAASSPTPNRPARTASRRRSNSA